MSVYVFAGPTLSFEQARPELEATYLPPAEQGDIFRVAVRGPRAIGIIDGYFQHRPAIWHKEILWAMSQGIHVYGAASMGALRAAELAAFGMEGVGEIFAAFRDGVLDDDDEVAVAHGLAESGYRATSEAMVNIRATLDSAVAGQVISRATAGAVLAIAKAVFYPERAYPLILRRAADEGVRPDELGALRDWLPGGAINLKKRDAVALLRRMRADLDAGEAPKKVHYHLEQTDFWHQAMRAATQGRSADRPGADPSLRPDGVLEELRLSGVPYLEARDRASLRDLALGQASRQGEHPGEDAVQQQLSRLRQRHGLNDDRALERWLEGNGLSLERLGTLVRQEALVARFLGQQDVWPALLDHLRLSGRYADLKQRSEEKDRLLRAAGQEDPTLAQTGLSQEALARWFFARLGPAFPADFARHARAFDFENADELVHAALREYCYQRLQARA